MSEDLCKMSIKRKAVQGQFGMKSYTAFTPSSSYVDQFSAVWDQAAAPCQHRFTLTIQTLLAHANIKMGGRHMTYCVLTLIFDLLNCCICAWFCSRLVRCDQEMDSRRSVLRLQLFTMPSKHAKQRVEALRRKLARRKLQQSLILLVAPTSRQPRSISSFPR